MKRGLRALTALVALAVAALALTLGCKPAARPSCPVGFAPDPTREQRLLALLEEEHASTPPTRALTGACFGATSSLGVLVEGRPLLDDHASERALAARLAHLAIHHEDKLGDGCARGRDAALASERRAREVEGALRVRWGLEARPDESFDAMVDYAARCPR